MKSLSGRTETLMLEKRGRLVRSRWVSLPGDTISNSKGLVSRQCLASDSIKSPRAPNRPGAGSCAKPGGEWRGEPRKTSSWLSLKIHVVCGVCHINCRKMSIDEPPASERPIGRVPQIGVLSAEKRRRAKRPGESNREASRLGDVGS